MSEFSIIFLIIFLLFLGFFLSPWANLEFNQFVSRTLSNLSNFTIYLNGYENFKLEIFLLISFGVLLVTNEANLVIRLIFNITGLKPQKKENKENKLDVEEFNAGRIIGIIERILIYIFVINSEYSAIGFILAAKGFARFKELDDRKFAEYVLVGTLISTLLAILVGSLVQNLIAN